MTDKFEADNQIELYTRAITQTLYVVLQECK